MVRIQYLAPIVAGAVGFYSGLEYMKSYTTDKVRVSAAGVVVNIEDALAPNFESSVSQNVILQHGIPSSDSILVKKSYVLSYDRRNRVPKWVMEHLTPHLTHKGKDVKKKNCDFFEDEFIHHYFRSSEDDYRGSGYDKGHLAAASNHRFSQDTLQDTFALSNVAPQVGKGFNQGAWLKLENHVQNLVEKYKSVYVCSGPLYIPRIESDGKKYVIYEVIGKNVVAVPTHFFKVIVYKKYKNEKYKMEAYVLKNEAIDENVPLTAFMVPKDVIERASGLLLFHKLSDSDLKFIDGKCLREK